MTVILFVLTTLFLCLDLDTRTEALYRIEPRQGHVSIELQNWAIITHLTMHNIDAEYQLRSE